MALPTITRSPPRTPRTFGDVVRDARVLAGFTLRDLGSVVRVAPSYLSDIENDRRIPSDLVMRGLANALTLDVDELKARAGQLDEQTVDYLRQHPRAGELLRLIAANRCSDEDLQALLEQVNRMRKP